MKNYYIIIIFIFCYNISYPQLVKIKVENLNDNKATLSFLSGENISVIDTIISLNESEFHFGLGNNHSGIYRLTLNNNKWIDFIYDKEDVVIETDADSIADNLKVIKSEINSIYYGFVNLNKGYKTKTELLQLILTRYPKEDDYYQTTKEKLVQVQEDYIYFVNVTAQVNQNSFIARYIRSSQLPVIDINIPSEEQLKYLKAHALDNVNFYDDGLIYSDAFTNKSIEYLTYYRNPQLLFSCFSIIISSN